MPEPRDHSQNRGYIESFLRVIPGFKGYLEKEYRRESDALAREQLVTLLQNSKRGIDDVTRGLVDAGQIDTLPQYDRVRGRIDKLIGQIRGAMQGYSGFFDYVQISEKELDKIYEADLNLLDEVELLSANVKKLSGGAADFTAAAMRLLAELDMLEQKWQLRDQLLKQGH
ncbi:MAG: hypothetical protein SFX18_13725 [Pirellulales bacterium]|nr:hypothetical protein [Pirellulales bacterium]